MLRYTHARLTAAVLLAILAGYVSEMIKLVGPPDTQYGYFTWVNVFLGAWVGWLVMGRRAGFGYVAAISNGLTGAVALVFWGLFVQGMNEMLRLALDRRYDGPMEAVTGVFQIMLDFGSYLMNVELLTTLVVESVFAAIFVEMIARRWHWRIRSQR